MIKLSPIPTHRERERERAWSGDEREAVDWSGEHVASTALSALRGETEVVETRASTIF